MDGHRIRQTQGFLLTQSPQMQTQLSTLTSVELAAVEHWEERLNGGDEYSRMCPFEFRDDPYRMTPTQVRGNIQGIGVWMSMMKVLAILLHVKKSGEATPEPEGKGKVCTEVGLGSGLLRGYDYFWVALASKMRLKLIDFAPSAVSDAREFLGRELGLISHSSKIHSMVQWGEARRYCQTLTTETGVLLACTILEHVGMGLDTAERLEAVKTTARGMGQILKDPTNVVQVINTPGNQFKRKGSMAIEDGVIFEAVQEGAQRAIYLAHSEEFTSTYPHTRFTCQTFMADVR